VTAEWNEDEAKANARLIAAAPSLLAALRELREHGVTDLQAKQLSEDSVLGQILKQADAAIAKAGGGSMSATKGNGSSRSDLTRTRQQVLASYREDNRRLKECNAELLKSLNDTLSAYHELTLGQHYTSKECQIKANARAAISKAKGGAL